jgi:uncharacterized protein (TIGR02217 family)
VTVEFALSKTYRSGLQTYERPVVKPVAGSVLVALAGDPKVDTLEFAMDHASGVITFASPPDIGVLITAGFEFDVPVRFDTDRLQTSVGAFQAGEVPSVPVIEVRV